MKQIKLYFSPLNNNYFTNEKDVCCSFCRDNIQKMCLCVCRWLKKGYFFEYYCPTCIKKVQMKGVVDELKVILVVPTIPEDAYPVLLTPPQLTKSNLSVFDCADRQISNEIVIDKTNQCHNPNFMVGYYKEFDTKAMLLEKDSDLPISSGLNLLDELAAAAPVIEYTGLKRLNKKSTTNEVHKNG